MQRALCWVAPNRAEFGWLEQLREYKSRCPFFTHVEMDLLAPSTIFCPAVTAQVFSDLSGLPLGVVEAQLDRRILPVLRLGKRRLVNLELLRVRALVESDKPGVQA